MIIRPLQQNWARAALTGIKNQPVCLVAIAGTAGSAPRETGALMLVYADHIEGSIGGGELEFQAIETARAHQPEASFERRIRTYPLGPSLGQCCGGHVKVMYEWYSPDNVSVLTELAALAAQSAGFSLHDTNGQAEPSYTALRSDPLPETMLALALDIPLPEVFIYGAGHVGRAVIELARHLACQIYWVDVDESRYPEAIPPGVTRLAARTPQTIAAHAPDDAIHIVMSYSHQLDYEIISALLTTGRFARCGLIGSHTKAARFRGRLRDSGLSQNQIDRLICPVGLPEVAGKTPVQVALSVTAQLSNWLADISA